MEMEKACEFCLILRPIVYCKADAAYLCLSCDAKVHSANALSNRHPRTLVCESCRYRPAYVQCSDHQMFMCRICDRNQHDLSTQHQRKVIGCYMGCPSAKDFAALWGFDMNEMDNDSKFQDQSLPTSSAAVDTGMVTFNNPRQSCSGAGISSVSDVTSTIGALPNMGSRGEHTKAANQRENIFHIWQQINDLKRLQLTQGGGIFSFVGGQVESDMSSFKCNAKGKLHENLDQHLLHSLDLGSDIHHLGTPHEKLTTEPFQLAFSQMEGDYFWQRKSPVHSGQLWTQNMQDLGVCDEIGCFDDLSMPDVDLTFKNIEELFGGEQELARALLDDNDTTCSSVEKDISVDKSDNGYERSVEDVSAASSVCISHSANKDVGSSDFGTSKECPFIQQSYSTSSFSLPRIGAAYVDSEPSSNFVRQQLSCNLSDLENAQSDCKENVQSDCKENVMMRYKIKKKTRRSEKQSQYTPRKARSDVKKMTRDQLTKTQDYESDPVNVTRSF